MAPSDSPPALGAFRRIVVKVGSSLLVDGAKGALRQGWLETLGADIARHAARGADVLVVSSGAIALGRTLLKLPKGPLELEQSQAAASVGQIALARAWSEVLGQHGIVAGQILVTLHDTEERRRYLNARNTMETLFGVRAVPVVNENDTVATDEIRYGDNDRLAARVATMASADLPRAVLRYRRALHRPARRRTRPRRHIPAGASGSRRRSTQWRAMRCLRAVSRAA